MENLQQSRLGEMLVDGKLLTEDQLRQALEMQKSVGGRLGAILVKLGFISDEALTNFIAESQSLRIAELENLVLPETLMQRLPRELIEKHHVVPVAFKDGVLQLATSDPSDFEAIEEIQLYTNYKVETMLASRAGIQKAISEFYYAKDRRAAEEEDSKGAKPSMDVMMRELEEGVEGELGRRAMEQEVTPAQVRRALIPLLIEKGIISEEDLIRKAKELG